MCSHSNIIEENYTEICLDCGEELRDTSIAVELPHERRSKNSYFSSTSGPYVNKVEKFTDILNSSLGRIPIPAHFNIDIPEEKRNTASEIHDFLSSRKETRRYLRYVPAIYLGYSGGNNPCLSFQQLNIVKEMICIDELFRSNYPNRKRSLPISLIILQALDNLNIEKDDNGDRIDRNIFVLPKSRNSDFYISALKKLSLNKMTNDFSTFLEDCRKIHTIGGVNNIEIKIENDLRGLFAKVELKKGDQILFVPDIAVIGWKRDQSGIISEIAKSIGRDREYKSYFNLILPTEETINRHPVVAHTDEEAKILHQYPLAAWNFLRQEYNSITTKFSEPNLVLLYKQAWYIYVTRAFTNAGVAPLIDFVNHSENPNATVKLAPSGFILEALSDIKEGDQIYINYGRKGPSCLYIQYGLDPRLSLHVCLPTIFSSTDKAGKSLARYAQKLFNYSEIPKKIDQIFTPSGPDEKTGQFVSAVSYMMYSELPLPNGFDYSKIKIDSLEKRLTLDLYERSFSIAHLEGYRNGPELVGDDSKNPFLQCRSREDNIISSALASIFNSWGYWVANLAQQQKNLIK